MGNMKPVSHMVPPEIQSRIEFFDVPPDWPSATWGLPHQRSAEGLSIDLWFFQLESGPLVLLESMPECQTLLVRSDSTDTRMLRLELGLRSMPGSDFRRALNATEAAELAEASRWAGKSVDDAIVAFEGRGAHESLVLDAVATAYEVPPALVRAGFEKHYPSSQAYSRKAWPSYRLSDE